MTYTTTGLIGRAIRFLGTQLGEAPLKHVGFQLWDGTRWPDDKPRDAILILKDPNALHLMFGGGTETRLAEAFLRDDFDVQGDIEAALELVDILLERGRGPWLKRANSLLQLHRFRSASNYRPAYFRSKPAGLEHSRSRDRQAISFHYDVSNDFFQLWLDRRMLYSCAYFTRTEDSLEEAQTAKLQHLCRKLRLRAGQRLLDVGCGWGGLAIFAARQFGAQVLAITLSAPQASLAAQRVKEAGLDREVKVVLCDYRDVNASEQFDAIVSVGMSEHVGRKNLASYFATLTSILKPGGVLLNHAIGEGVRARASRGPSFIQDYVFPDSDIPPIPVVLGAGEAAGLEVRDVENLREHYMFTLRHWVRRLEANHSAALAFVDEPTFRVWRLYMAASAHGFDRGNLAIYQALFSKPDDRGHADLPLTREDWYRPVSK
jgi:cyclopropane-fatty-acyl-phospholipid synthase